MKTTIRDSCLVMTLVLLSTATAATAAINTGELQTRTVALTGDPAPGGLGNTPNFVGFNSAGINEAGEVTFFAQHTRSRLDLWTESGALGQPYRLVMAFRDPVPGQPGDLFEFNLFPYNVQLTNDAGQVLFPVEIPNSQGDLGALWIDEPGGLRKIMQVGDATPNIAGGTFLPTFVFPLSVRLNNSGQTLFYSVIDDPSSPPGSATFSYWLDDAGVLKPLMVQGDLAPGARGAQFGTADPLGALNQAGQVAFTADLEGTGVNSVNNAGIWRTTPDGILELVARRGDPLPGEPGLFNGGFFGPSLNDSGQMVANGSIQFANGFGDPALWSDVSGQWVPIVRELDPVPGLPGTVYFDGFFSGPILNNTGQILFRAVIDGQGITGQNEIGVWMYENDRVRTLAREGDPAAGTNGAIFSLLEILDLNDSGQVLLNALLNGPGVTGSNNSGIWAIDSDGEIVLLAREGDLFDVNDDPAVEDWRTISLIQAGSQMNNRGEVVLSIEFADDTEGVFVVTIPEPSSLAVFAGLVLLSARRRRG